MSAKLKNKNQRRRCNRQRKDEVKPYFHWISHTFLCYSEPVPLTRRTISIQPHHAYIKLKNSIQFRFFCSEYECLQKSYIFFYREHALILLVLCRKGNNQHTLSRIAYFYGLIHIGMDD